jgi:hypothetical protein
MSLKATALAATLSQSLDRERKVDGGVSIGDDKIIRWREGLPVSRNGRQPSRAGNRGLDIGAILLRPCSLRRRRFGTVSQTVHCDTVNKPACLQCSRLFCIFPWQTYEHMLLAVKCERPANKVSIRDRISSGRFSASGPNFGGGSAGRGIYSTRS